MSQFDDKFDESGAFEAAATTSLSARAMAARPADYMNGLNPEQVAAVKQIDGPVLMLAGAGTGKTRALMTRLTHLVRTGSARPDEILAVTFTNKAAKEMKDRLGNVPFGIERPIRWLGTFHSICAKILRRHAELVGLKSTFTILDTDDQNRLLKQLIVANKIDEKRHPPRALGHLIDSWKNRAWTPEKVPAAEDRELWAERLYSDRDLHAVEQTYEFARRNPGSGAIGREIVLATQIYAQYQTRLRELNACDFGDLLLHVIQIFQENEDLL
ncbi:MAG: UvrD-helicase domain-containing protein, partial [Roseicyclus sp.]|nr:UvrD-helicase domain-containing protein [Roseicyclus sp.]